MDCFCVLSDSGTAPEEALFYKVPCVSLRMTTERPETVEGGAHIVAGMDVENIVEAVTPVTQPGMGGPLRSRREFRASVGGDQLHPQPDHQLVLRTNGAVLSRRGREAIRTAPAPACGGGFRRASSF